MYKCMYNLHSNGNIKLTLFHNMVSKTANCVENVFYFIKYCHLTSRYNLPVVTFCRCRCSGLKWRRQVGIVASRGRLVRQSAWPPVTALAASLPPRSRTHQPVRAVTTALQGHQQSTPLGARFPYKWVVIWIICGYWIMRICLLLVWFLFLFSWHNYLLAPQIWCWLPKNIVA